ncbi:MAG: hypothetical protein RBG13Loki_2020 [Promethearchaeota archaeon CR_4]|nr:MAG: hypothetical protein RBG13Loki_2020 [Candidatus Lokiarchaeota archaeon CR_4]
MTSQDERHFFSQSCFRRLGAVSEPHRVLDVNARNFDDIIKHFGQRAFQLGIVQVINPSPISKQQIATPVVVTRVATPTVSASELIARQHTFLGKITPLTKGIIAAWAIFNLTWILFSLLGII